jgi:hypothetical protein
MNALKPAIRLITSRLAQSATAKQPRKTIGMTTHNFCRFVFIPKLIIYGVGIRVDHHWFNMLVDTLDYSRVETRRV